MNNINKLIDHTILKNSATTKDVEKLCNEAIMYDFMSVCVNPTNVSLAAKLLVNSDVKVCTVVGFPLGANTVSTKVFETKDAISNGASEIDMVVNIAKVKEGDFDYITNEISEVVKVANGTLVKVIIETCELTKDEIRKCSECVLKAKAQFVKTSTGFSSGGALEEDVKIMKDVVKDNASVKASGGIRDLATLQKMVDAGATRIGCSAGVNIMKELKGEVIKNDSNSTY